VSTGHVALLRGQKSNHRSDVALTMNHKLCGISSCGINGLRTGYEHPT